MNGTAKRAGLFFAAIGFAAVSVWLAFLLTGHARIEPSPRGTEPSPTPGTYESTKHLTGEELASALGLEPLSLPDGPITNTDPRLEDCQVTKENQDQAGSIVNTGSAVYCTVGIVSNEFEAWELGMRLAGRVPSELEQEAYRLDLQAQELYESGDVEAAEKLWHQVHRLRVQAAGGADELPSP
jgi:hypothetical protein